MDHTEEWRHFDTLLWQVSSILLAANGVLIGAFAGLKNSEIYLRAWIFILGYILTIATVYFTSSFRIYMRRFDDKRISHNPLKQWPFYVFICWFIGMFWSFSLWQPNKYLIAFCSTFAVIMTALLLCLFLIGEGKKDHGIRLSLSTFIIKIFMRFGRGFRRWREARRLFL